jgi:hypothetical protein
MKITVLLLLIGLFSQIGISQTLLDTKKVPANVIKKFSKKHRDVTEVKWYLYEHNYMVKCLDKGLQSEIVYSSVGKELFSKSEVEIGSLNSKIADDLRANHKDKKIIAAYLYANGPRDKYYSVILHKSQGRKKPPLEYEAQYTFTGAYLTLYEPEINMDGPEEVKDDKYDKEMDSEVDDFEDTVDDQKIKKGDLPSPIIQYVKDNFEYEYRYKEIWIKNNAKYGDFYYIVLKKQGEKKKFKLYFDTFGKFLNKEVEEW